ncbi:acetyl-CoA carboxylase [Lacticaseibacillus kribbianus]|uniref:acetyl-CoA carboxylase n=1 Tax=Lacticaseibacillus kribbianus TaxID=2926292 RepID=UPI001CD48D3B|nr:acetyl-CoA carboxylase [Lacticaseibacillus kribbianus]
MSTQQDIRVINDRIDALFKRAPHTRYWLTAVHNGYDHEFSFFFWQQRRGERQKSLPLHSLQTEDIDVFAAVIAGIRAHTNLSIDYFGFTKERWPATGELIQKRQRDIETNVGLPF